MNTKTTLIAGASLVLAAALLSFRPSPPSHHSTVQTGQATKSRLRATSHATRDALPASRVTRAEEPDETAGLLEWRKRLDDLIRDQGDRERAIRTLLSEVSTTYDGWVREQTLALVNRPPVDRCEKMMRIAISMNEGVSAIIESVGIDKGCLSSVTAGPLETLAAEIQYSEMAPDPESRLARMRLDRERHVRLEQASALTDAADHSQALSELDAWYQARLGGIFAPGGIE